MFINGQIISCITYVILLSFIPSEPIILTQNFQIFISKLSQMEVVLGPRMRVFKLNYEYTRYSVYHITIYTL